jgi:hypothetical protein
MNTDCLLKKNHTLINKYVVNQKLGYFDDVRFR